MHDLDACLFGILDCCRHFFQRLLFLETIENLLTPAFNPEHDRPAMGLRHSRKQMLCDRVHAPFNAPLDRELLVHHTFANRLDPLRLQQKMIFDKIDRPIAAFFEVLEFAHHMLGTPRTPLAFVEDRNVAEHAGPWAASRGLHGREPLHREYRWYVEGHRFNEIERETFAIGEGPLIEMAFHRPTGILHNLAILGPGQPGNTGWVINSFE